jgi:hypothetical protein
MMSEEEGEMLVHGRTSFVQLARAIASLSRIMLSS